MKGMLILSESSAELANPNRRRSIWFKNHPDLSINCIRIHKLFDFSYFTSDQAVDDKYFALSLKWNYVFLQFTFEVIEQNDFLDKNILCKIRTFSQNMVMIMIMYIIKFKSCTYI